MNVMVPWLCLTIPFILIKLVFQRASLFNELYDLFSGNSFWYIPCCIVAEIVWFFINKYCRSVRMVIVISLVLSIFGIVFSSHRILEFAKTNIAMIAQYWIMLGYLCRYYEDKFKCVKCSYIILMSLLYIGMGFLSLSLWPESSIDVKNHIYYNYPFNFAMITLGCITVYLLAEWLEKTAKGGGYFKKFSFFRPKYVGVFFLTWLQCSLWWSLCFPKQMLF